MLLSFFICITIFEITQVINSLNTQIVFYIENVICQNLLVFKFLQKIGISRRQPERSRYDQFVDIVIACNLKL